MIEGRRGPDLRATDGKAAGWTPEEALHVILGPWAWEDYPASAVDVLLLRHVMRRDDLYLSGCPFPGAKRQRVPKALAADAEPGTTGPFALNVLARTLSIRREEGPPTILVDVRIERLTDGERPL